MTSGDISTVPDRSVVVTAMRSASRAPSVHNTQPWRWVCDGPSLRLYRDDTRLLEVADPEGRQLVISCGAMVHHVRTAFAASGWHTDILRMPDPARPDWLAVLEFRPWNDPPAGVRARAEAMGRRYTERLAMHRPDGWDDLVHRLRMLASPHDVEVDVLDDTVRSRLVTASEHSAAVQRYDMQYQAELHWWTGHAHPTQGVPPQALVTANSAIARSFPPAGRASGPEPAADEARLIVLSTDGDTTEQWLRAGEALSAVLLECTTAGQATCALTHLTELSAARRLLAGLIRHPLDPQVVVRIGTSDNYRLYPKTPRRPVTEFLTFAPSAD
ncbi:Acg family FMN-binding oxidoreductase [Nocardia arizonensis]|uniref:Acg family FMN-binding oxidoreductase n=1 Tax=Nocardia arizonensis TaxID=1141647 RepID=UPI0006D2B9E1|nr:hypothetical protein [Nocardia arizonensis]